MRIPRTKAFTLIELLIYVGLVAGIFVFVVGTLISFTRSYRDLSALRAIDQSAVNGMERITRDTRSATSVDSGNSTLGTSTTQGVLTLLQTSGGVSTTTKFYLQGGKLKVDVNGTYSGPLSVSNATVSSLTFILMSSSVSQAVRVDMTVQSTSSVMVRTKNFHSTVVLKGS